MNLFVKSRFGKTIPIESSAKTRTQFILEHKESSEHTFEIEEDEFHVKDIYALPNNDTSIGLSIMLFVLFLLICKNWEVPLMLVTPIFIIAKIIYLRSKVAANTFNES
jgi:hypothetical protein